MQDVQEVHASSTCVLLWRKGKAKQQSQDRNKKTVIIMWAAAQIIYLNSCQSRFLGVYLVL